MALTYYVNDHLEYLAALGRPTSGLPKGTRKTFADLFDNAAAAMPGIRKVYELLPAERRHDVRVVLP